VRVVLDCDLGNGIPGADIDDGLALALALRAPEVQLEAVMLVAGNVSVDDAVGIALRMLAADDDHNTPVYRGSPVPLVQDPRWWRAELDGRGQCAPAREIWDGAYRFPETSRRAEALHAALALIELASRYSGQIHLVATGPLTNVALAFLLAPGMAHVLARLIIMGGAFTGPGGLRELNFAYDPEAAHIVLGSGAPITLVPLDVTRQTFFTPQHNQRLLECADAFVRSTGRTVVPWISWLAATRGVRGCHLHDPLAMAVAIDPSLVETSSSTVAVELTGEYLRGRPTRWLPSGLELSAETGARGRPIEVAQTVDNDRFLAFLLDALTRG